MEIFFGIHSGSQLAAVAAPLHLSGNKNFAGQRSLEKLNAFRTRGGRYLGRFFVGEDEVVEVDVDHVEAAADRQGDLADVVALSLPQRRRYAQVLKKTNNGTGLRQNSGHGFESEGRSEAKWTGPPNTGTRKASPSS